MEENQFLYVKQETWDRINEKMPPEEELQDLAKDLVKSTCPCLEP